MKIFIQPMLIATNHDQQGAWYHATERKDERHSWPLKFPSLVSVDFPASSSRQIKLFSLRGPLEAITYFECGREENGGYWIRGNLSQQILQEVLPLAGDSSMHRVMYYSNLHFELNHVV